MHGKGIPTSIIFYHFIAGIKDGFIKRFPTFAKLKEYACKAPDPELCGKIKVGYSISLQ